MCSDGFSFLISESAYLPFGQVGGVSIEKHHFQTPILRMTSVSKTSLTIFPQCQCHSFLTYLQFRNALVIHLDKLFVFVFVFVFVCLFLAREQHMKEMGINVAKKRAVPITNTPSIFKEELIPNKEEWRSIFISIFISFC